MSGWTLRGRLTVLYGGLFLAAGTLLPAVTYLMVGASLDRRIGADPAVVAALPTTPSSAREDERMAQAIGELHAAERQFRRITETAERIAHAAGARRGLHKRIAPAGPRDEVKQLADAFDVMLDRLDRSSGEPRRFAANASHELRTPRPQPGAGGRGGDPPGCHRRHQTARRVAAGRQRTPPAADRRAVDADRRRERQRRSSPADLAEIAAHVLDRTAAPGARVRRTLAAAPVHGDPVLLERMVENLVENAVQHNTVDGWVAVRTGTEPGGGALLTVSNTGPLVPSHETEALFQPFRRLSRTRVGGGRGYGLGLSIVRATARAHGGRAHALHREGGGLTVTVALPGRTSSEALDAAERAACHGEGHAWP